MSVTVYIPGMLRPRCGGARHLSVEAGSVRHALEEIERRFPELYLGICEETGAVRRHVNLFVNVANVRDLEGVDTPLSPGDELTILPSVSGG
jgi:molybdopterin converting factor small subunit